MRTAIIEPTPKTTSEVEGKGRLAGAGRTPNQEAVRGRVPIRWKTVWRVWTVKPSNRLGSGKVATQISLESLSKSKVHAGVHTLDNIDTLLHG